MTNPGYVLLLVTYGLNVGVFYAISTLLVRQTKYLDVIKSEVACSWHSDAAPSHVKSCKLQSDNSGSSLGVVDIKPKVAF